MAGIYPPRHPERTVLYRVLFHYFDRFLSEYEDRFHHIQMRIIAFLTNVFVVDRIINHLKLSFVASNPPPPRIAYKDS